MNLLCKTETKTKSEMTGNVRMSRWSPPLALLMVFSLADEEEAASSPRPFGGGGDGGGEG